MEKQEIIASLIMESVSDPVKPRNVQVQDKNGLFYVNFDTTLQGFNVQNRNRRTYEERAMLESLNAPHIMELIRNRTWLGEAGHPLTKDNARIMTIDPKLTSHRINSFESRAGGLLHANIDTLDDNGFGTRMTRNILQGMEPAFSLRALAHLIKKPDGSSLVKSRSHIVTYDWVILPSHPNAYRDKSKPITQVMKNFANEVETSGNAVTESNIIIPVLESQIADFIAMESVNVNIISNVCEVMKSSMELTHDLKTVILREGSHTYSVKVEDHIRKEVMSYMSRI